MFGLLRSVELQFWAKREDILHFLAKRFAYIKKLLYLCTRYDLPRFPLDQRTRGGLRVFMGLFIVVRSVICLLFSPFLFALFRKGFEQVQADRSEAICLDRFVGCGRVGELDVIVC